MKVNLNMLPYEINKEIVFPENYYSNSEIKDLKNVIAKGKIDYNLTDEIEINLEVEGIMYLKDAITNEVVEYPFSFKIEELLENFDGESEKYYEKSKNILDIIEFLWENIVLEVPISYTKVKDVHKKGEGWELNNEEPKDDVDPRMAKLSEIFKGGE